MTYRRAGIGFLVLVAVCFVCFVLWQKVLRVDGELPLDSDADPGAKTGSSMAVNPKTVEYLNEQLSQRGYIPSSSNDTTVFWQNRLEEFCKQAGTCQQGVGGRLGQLALQVAQLESMLAKASHNQKQGLEAYNAAQGLAMLSHSMKMEKDFKEANIDLRKFLVDEKSMARLQKYRVEEAPVSQE